MLKHQQLNLASLLLLMAIAPIFIAALGGVFGERIERTVYEVSVFVTLATAWLLFQVTLYAVIISPVVLLWLIAQHRRRTN